MNDIFYSIAEESNLITCPSCGDYYYPIDDVCTKCLEEEE